MKHILTFDAGTGSGRALLFDFHGRQIAGASREWSAPSLTRYPGSAVFDTTAAWELLCQCVYDVLRSAKIDPQDIAAVTATSMREGFVLYDASQREIWACPNIDARATTQAAELIKQGLDEVIYQTGGDGLAITAPPRLRWIAQCEPAILDKAHRLSMISDWVLFRLSGEICTDPSAGSSSGLFDLSNSSWSPTLLALLQLPAIFPPVVAPGTVIGKVSARAALETGLVAGTPVVMGGADTQLGLLGACGAGASPLTVVGGTFWQTTLATDRPLIDPQRRLRTLCHVHPGQWMTEGIGFLNGLAMRWLRDTLCSDLVARSASTGSDAYTLMEQWAEAVPAGADGVMAFVSDVMNAKRWIQAPITFTGLNPTSPNYSGQRGRALMIRAIEESAVFTACEHWMILQDLAAGVKSPQSVTFCGGASKGRLWPQILADVFALPVQIPKVSEATSLGAAFCALVGLREFQTLSEAAKALVHWERTVEPDRERVQVYAALRPQHRQLQAHLIEWVTKGELPAMWRAPGA